MLRRCGTSCEKKVRKFTIQSDLAERQKALQQGSGAFFSGFISVGLISLGCAFLFVPIFRLYCQPQGHGADPKFLAQGVQKDEEQSDTPPRKKLLKVRFLSDVGNTMPIAFVPLQRSVEMLIGEPSLAFYSAYNKSNRTLLGVSTYTISPPEATPYLNKIQCFCFEEQRFKPHELVEMPVFFYIDKDFLNDPMLNWLDEVILNYTFFNLDRTRDIIAQF
jgi:cytochrome c oxidase assembly protein subunit 11